MLIDTSFHNLEINKQRQFIFVVCIMCLCFLPFKLCYGVNSDILQRLKVISTESDKSIDQAKEQEINELVLKFVEDGSVYLFSSADTNQLKKKIEEFCTQPLSDEIYERSLKYLGVATSWNSKQIKSINLLQKGNDIIAVIRYLELEVTGEEVGMMKCTLNLKRTKVGWRIYNQQYEKL